MKRFTALFLAVCLMATSFVSPAFAASVTYTSFMDKLVEMAHAKKTETIDVFTVLENQAKELNDDAKLTARVTEFYANLSPEGKSIMTQYGYDNEKLKVTMAKSRDIFLRNYTGTKLLSFIVLVDEDKAAAKKQLDKDFEELVSVLPAEFKAVFAPYGTNDYEKGLVVLSVLDALMVNNKFATDGANRADLDLYVSSNVISIINAKLANPSQGGQAVVFGNGHLSVLNSLANLTEKAMNEAGKANSFKTMVSAIGGYEAKPNDNGGSNNNNGGNSGGSGGGGGGAAVTPTTPTVTPGKQTATAPAMDPSTGNTVTKISADAVTQKVEGTTVVLEAKKEDLAKAIEAVLKAPGVPSQKIDIVYDLPTVKTADFKMSLPVEALKALQGKPAQIILETAEVKITLPIENFKLTDSAAKVSFESKLVKPTDVKIEAAAGVAKTAKVIDFTLNMETASGKSSITSFTAPVVVRISLEGLNLNADKTVLAYLMPAGGIEVVGNRIENGQIIGQLNHFSQYAVVERNVELKDMANHWAAKYVASLSAKDVVKGYDGDMFKPEQNVSRAEFAVMISKTIGLAPKANNGSFTDVAKDHWAAGYIQAVKDAGIVNGYAGGKFNPDQKITRAEMAVMMQKALKLADGKATQFADQSDIPTWAANAVSAVVAKEFMMGGTGNFRANDATTRAEVSAVLYKTFQK